MKSILKYIYKCIKNIVEIINDVWYSKRLYIYVNEQGETEEILM
jgi:hypothetical protein